MSGLTKATIDELLRKLQQLPLTGAKLAGRSSFELDVNVSTGLTIVPHPLGAVPRMVVVSPPNVNAVVFQPQPPTRDAFFLQASAACVVRAFVF